MSTNIDNRDNLVNSLKSQIDEFHNQMEKQPAVLEQSIKGLVSDWIEMERSLDKSIKPLPKDMVVKFHAILTKKLEHEVKTGSWWKFWRIGRKKDAKLGLERVENRAVLIYKSIYKGEVNAALKGKITNHRVKLLERKSRPHMDESGKLLVQNKAIEINDLESLLEMASEKEFETEIQLKREIMETLRRMLQHVKNIPSQSPASEVAKITEKINVSTENFKTALDDVENYQKTTQEFIKKSLSLEYQMRILLEEHKQNTEIASEVHGQLQELEKFDLVQKMKAQLKDLSSANFLEKYFLADLDESLLKSFEELNEIPSTNFSQFQTEATKLMESLSKLAPSKEKIKEAKLALEKQLEALTHDLTDVTTKIFNNFDKREDEGAIEYQTRTGKYDRKREELSNEIDRIEQEILQFENEIAAFDATTHSIVRGLSDLKQLLLIAEEQKHLLAAGINQELRILKDASEILLEKSNPADTESLDSIERASKINPKKFYDKAKDFIEERSQAVAEEFEDAKGALEDARKTLALGEEAYQAGANALKEEEEEEPTRALFEATKASVTEKLEQFDRRFVTGKHDQSAVADRVEDVVGIPPPLLPQTKEGMLELINDKMTDVMFEYFFRCGSTPVVPFIQTLNELSNLNKLDLKQLTSIYKSIEFFFSEDNLKLAREQESKYPEKLQQVNDLYFHITKYTAERYGLLARMNINMLDPRADYEKAKLIEKAYSPCRSIHEEINANEIIEKFLEKLTSDKNTGITSDMCVPLLAKAQENIVSLKIKETEEIEAAVSIPAVAMYLAISECAGRDNVELWFELFKNLNIIGFSLNGNEATITLDKPYVGKVAENGIPIWEEKGIPFPILKFNKEIKFSFKTSNDGVKQLIFKEGSMSATATKGFLTLTYDLKTLTAGGTAENPTIKSELYSSMIPAIETPRKNVTLNLCTIDSRTREGWIQRMIEIEDKLKTEDFAWNENKETLQSERARIKPFVEQKDLTERISEVENELADLTRQITQIEAAIATEEAGSETAKELTETKEKITETKNKLSEELEKIKALRI